MSWLKHVIDFKTMFNEVTKHIAHVKKFTMIKSVPIHQVISLDYEWIHWFGELHPHFVIILEKKSYENNLSVLFMHLGTMICS